MPPLGFDFFDRPTLTVSRELLGCSLHWDQVSGIVVETEAYGAKDDDACHTSFRPSAGRFFETHPPGTAYVYLNYGIQWMLNVLGRDGIVLIRALEPASGVELMKQTQQQQQQELIRTQTNANTDLMKLEAELAQFPTHAKTRVLDLEKALSDMRQRHLEVQGRKGAGVRAPIDGVEDALMAKPGLFQGQVQQTQPLLAVIPNQSMIQAHMLVPTRAMGFIKAGQTVRIRYAAFPYQRYGGHEGVVHSVSQHILNPNELAAPLEIIEPVYQVVVNLKAQNIKAYGKEMRLQAGMMIEADIILDNQSLIRWILDPIYTLKGKV